MRETDTKKLSNAVKFKLLNDEINQQTKIVQIAQYGITGYGVSRQGIQNPSIIFVPKLRSVAQNEWKKTPIYIFLLSLQR